MSTHTFIPGPASASRVDVDDNLRLLWVLRDVLDVTGPKYGCGINVCKACTSHFNGKAFDHYAVEVKDVGPDDDRHNEGLPDTVGKDLHPCRRPRWNRTFQHHPAAANPGRSWRRWPRSGRHGPPVVDQRLRPRRDPQHLPLRILHRIREADRGGTARMLTCPPECAPHRA